MGENHQTRRTLGMFQEVMIKKHHFFSDRQKSITFFPIDFFRTAFLVCFYPNNEKKSMTL